MDWAIKLDWSTICGALIIIGVPAILYFLWNINNKLRSLCEQLKAIKERVGILEEHEHRIQILKAT